MSNSIFFATSELSPYHGTTPRGELMSELAMAASKKGADVTVLAPFVEGMKKASGLARRLKPLTISVGNEHLSCTLYEGQLRQRSSAVWFVEIPLPVDASPAVRAFALGRAALALLEDRRMEPDILHSADWTTGFVPLLLRKEARLAKTKVVFTVTTPAETGCYPRELLDEIGFGHDDFHPEGFEFHGEVSLLKAGLVHADRITTTSQATAELLTTEAGSAGLHGLYSSRSADLFGILPGVDPVGWNPENDHRIRRGYKADDLAGKAECKSDLQQGLELDRRPGTAVVLAPSSNAQIVLETQDKWFDKKLQVVFFGGAEQRQQHGIEKLRERAPRRIAIADGRDETLHRLLGGADAIWLPHGSLANLLLLLKAKRYGVAPLAANDGHFQDLLADFDLPSRTGNAFLDSAADGNIIGLGRLLACYEQKDVWGALQQQLMSHRYQWALTGDRYGALYGQVLA